MAKFTLNNCAQIQNWFLNSQNKVKNDISLKDVFKKYKNQELKNYLKFKRATLKARITDIEAYLESLQNVVLLISTEYKSL
jgi:hypothetical protein